MLLVVDYEGSLVTDGLEADLADLPLLAQSLPRLERQLLVAFGRDVRLRLIIGGLGPLHDWQVLHKELLSGVSSPLSDNLGRHYQYLLVIGGELGNCVSRLDRLVAC